MSNEREAICVGPCKCGGYGIVYDEQAEKELGMCHKTIEAALQSQSNTDGWVLVPVEPTREMWDAVNKLDDEMAAGGYDGKGCSIEQAWDCLIAAAPTPPQQEQSGEALTASEAAEIAKTIKWAMNPASKGGWYMPQGWNVILSKLEAIQSPATPTATASQESTPTSDQTGREPT